MTRCTLTFVAALTVLTQGIALAAPTPPSATLPPAPDESKVRPFPLTTPVTQTARRGLTFQTPEAFPVEARGVMSVVKLPGGSELDVHTFGCEPGTSPLDPNYIAECLEPAMTANFPRLARVGPGVAFDHPAGKAARFRYSGFYGEGESRQLVVGVVYALVQGDSTALLITECPPNGELPSMEIMQPIFRTFTFTPSASSTAPNPSSVPHANGKLPHAIDLAGGARIAYPDGFTATVDHNTLTLKPTDPAGPTITVIDRLHGAALPGTVIRSLLPELQDEFPTLHRTEDPVITSSTIAARLTGKIDGQDRDAALRAVVKGKHTLRITLVGAPAQVNPLEPTLDTIIAESAWPPPDKK